MLNSIIIISTFILFSIIIPKSRNDNENDKYLSLDTSTILRGIAAYSGGYPFSISGDIRSVPS